MSVTGRLALAAALCAFLCAGACALEITACADGPAKGRKDFALSGVMVLAGVGSHAGLGDGGRAVVLSDPWRGVRILDRGFAQKLLEAQRGGAALSPSRKIQPKLEVLSASPLDSNFRIANVEIAFDGELLAVFGVVRRRGFGTDSYSVVSPDFLVLQDEELNERVRRLALDAGKRALRKA